MKMCVLSIYGNRVLTFVIVYLVCGLPNPRVSPANFAAIRQGMTEQEVEKVLGTPSKVKDVSRYSVTKMVPSRQGVRGFRLMKTSSWIGIDRVILIDFGKNGTVEWVELESLEEWAESNNVDSASVLGAARYWLITEPSERVRTWLIAKPDK